MKNDNSTENESEKEQLLQRLDRAIASSKHARSVLNRELDELLTRYDRRPEFVDERRICGIAERVEPTGVSYRANGAYVVDSDGIITVGIGSLPEFEDQCVDMFRNGIDELAKEYQTTKDASKKAELRNDIREKVNILNRINRESTVDIGPLRPLWIGSDFGYGSRTEDGFSQFLVEYGTDEQGTFTRLKYIGSPDDFGEGRFVGVAPEKR